jgi:hypothetical protein
METRKHLPRAVLARIYFIDRQIASGNYPNVHTLSREYEVGTATIYRDIEYMRDTLNAPIEYSAKHRGWYYEEKAFRLPARFAAADDMLALGMAKSLISYGICARPIEPPELVKEWKSNISALYEKVKE